VTGGFHTQRNRNLTVLQPELVTDHVEHRRGRAKSRPAQQERKVARHDVHPEPLEAPSETDGYLPMAVG